MTASTASTATSASSAGTEERMNDFIAALQQLDAGSLARLRRNAGNSLAESRGVLDVFYRIAPFGLSAAQEERYFLVATLYQPRLDPPASESSRPPNPGNFGDTLRRVADPREDGSAGVQRRLAALLDAEGPQVNFRLRQLVRLVDAHRGAIDWRQLLHDLLRWDYSDRRTQRAWARSYFGATNDKPSEPSSLAGEPDDRRGDLPAGPDPS
ncbi:MAG TPA: type I-E CRISPR-associated protein Cse2/CasB [Thermomicrobiaceae bacterium]|nr:type I-E CRISPR-associated protein Cse2/CasB [Thermomicrobiaceae bacterium]